MKQTTKNKIRWDEELQRFIEEFKPFQPKKPSNRTHIHRVI